MSNLSGLSRKTLMATTLVGALSLAVWAQTTGSSGQVRSTGPGVAVKVRGSVQQTIDQLKKMVADNGMMIMGELHQGKVLAMTGLKVQSETIFVGNPTVGKQLFSQEPAAGLVVPIRINIYADGQGRTTVRYIPPSQQLAEFHNAKVDEVSRMLDTKLHNMVNMLEQ